MYFCRQNVYKNKTRLLDESDATGNQRYIDSILSCYYQTIMVIVSTRDFRTNQTKYLNLAKAGEHVVLKSRAGSFRIFPDDGSNTVDAPRDLMKELRNALTEVKETMAGKRKLQSADRLLDEL